MYRLFSRHSVAVALSSAGLLAGQQRLPAAQTPSTQPTDAQLLMVLKPDRSPAHTAYHAACDIIGRLDANGLAAVWSWTLVHASDFSVPGQASLPAVFLDRAAALEPDQAVALVHARLAAQPAFSDGGESLPYDLCAALVKNGQLALARKTLSDWAPTAIGAAIDNAAWETVGRELGKTSLADAVSWLLTMPTASARNEALATMLGRWAESDPAAAMARAEQLHESDGRTAAIQRVFNRWVDADVDAATTWLSTRAPDPRLDRLAWYFATDTTFRYVKPAIALRAALFISDPDMRAKAIEHVILILARHENAAAKKFVENTSALTSEQKKVILQRLAGRRSH